MKIFNKQLVLVLGVVLWFSCDDDTLIDHNPSNPVTQKVADPYVQVQTPVVGFQAGTETYDIAFNAINGEKEITKVNVYSTFTDAATGGVTNEVLLGTYGVENSNRNIFTDELTYADLRNGLTPALPESDTELAVGSGWKLRFEGVFADGGTTNMPGNINIAVLSPYAGLYKATYAEYWRIGVRRDDVSDPWIGTEFFIGSVDENTFSHNDWWGPFAWPGESFNFDVDLDTYEITVPILTESGLFSGTAALSCDANAGDLSHAHCGESNVLIPDPLFPTSGKGKHIIKLSYGYAGSGGSREFYTILEKVVD
jgi:hypothetical protein